jgi:hypothetical protein
MVNQPLHNTKTKIETEAQLNYGEMRNAVYHTLTEYGSHLISHDQSNANS